MTLPLEPPIQPQLARSRESLPTGEEWAYEPKLDGFRAIVFADGDETYIQSRGGRPLSRYFPELDFPSGRYVIDGEIAIVDPAGGQDFEALQARLHPAESRVRKLAAETPARFFAFDLLALADDVLLERPFADRREALEDHAADRIELTTLSRDTGEAERWLAATEGVVAKELAAPYRPGERKGMVKIKRVRTIDCVVVGWRPGKEEGTVGSLILGLYPPGGELTVVGHTSSFRSREKRELRERLAPYETGERGSGDPSRWTSGRDLEWVSLRPELVVEVAADHVSGGRIRHGAKLLRWRDDKSPRECKINQLEA